MDAGPRADTRPAFRTTEENARIAAYRDLAASLSGPSSVHDHLFPAPTAVVGSHTCEEDLAHARGDVLCATEVTCAASAALASDHDAAAGRGISVRRHSGEPVLPEGGQRGFDVNHHAGPAALSGSAGRRAFAVRHHGGPAATGGRTEYGTAPAGAGLGGRHWRDTLHLPAASLADDIRQSTLRWELGAARLVEAERRMQKEWARTGGPNFESRRSQEFVAADADFLRLRRDLWETEDRYTLLHDLPDDAYPYHDWPLQWTAEAAAAHRHRPLSSPQREARRQRYR